MTPPTLDLPPPTFGFQVRILELNDPIPGTPGQAAPVSSYPNIITVSGVQSWNAIFRTTTNVPGSEAVVINVNRKQASQTIHGSIERDGGQWYWIGGGQRIPLAANDPCVTRLWPGGHSMSSDDYAHFCTTRVVAGFEETVWAFNLEYDLASEEVSGTVGGPAGKAFELHHGNIDLSFVIDALDSRSFEHDIRPLFRDVDVASMRGQDLDLTSYQAVKANAPVIWKALSYTLPALQMPCDGKWPPGPLLVFQQWMAQGMPA
jgi:hypothetical protein